MKFSTIRPRIAYLRSRQARVVYVLMALAAAAALAWSLWKHYLMYR